MLSVAVRMLKRLDDRPMMISILRESGTIDSGERRIAIMLPSHHGPSIRMTFNLTQSSRLEEVLLLSWNGCTE